MTSESSRRVRAGHPSWSGDVHDGVSAWTGGAGAPCPPPPPDEREEGPDADAESVARSILLDQLTGRARSRRELADKLRQRHVPDDLASRLLDRFEQVGLVDDQAFARAWVAGRGAGGGRGLARRALAQELRRKGVAEEVAREALDEVDPAEEEDAARTLVRKRMRSLGGVDRGRATRRLVGMLGRRGYPPGLAFTVVREELDREVSGEGSPTSEEEPDWQAD